MGAGASRVGPASSSTDNPLPTTPAHDKNLNKLSTVAARVLGTPDIYDVDNLARPGVCGDYAVFLKKYLEKEVKTALNPFVTEVDLSGKGGAKERVEIVFANPRKLMSEKAREEICKSISTAMLRTIAIIVASLASIQIAVPARKTAVAGIGAQKGGAYTDVLGYLGGRYIDLGDSTKPVGTRLKMKINPGISAKGIRFYLTLDTPTSRITPARISAEGGATHSDGEMPKGSLPVQFLDPVALPVAGDKKVLPVRIMDAGGMPWLAGVLYENVFISFYNNPSKSVREQQLDFSEIVEMLFRKTQGWPGLKLHETRAESYEANKIFVATERTGSPATMFAALAQFTQTLGPPVGYPPAAGYGGYAAPYPGAPAAAIAPIYPYAGAAPTAPAAPAAYGSLMRLPAGVVGQQLQYTIPQTATKNLLETLKSFGTKLAIENSPAAMRAQSLAGVPTASRDIQTNLCQDSYWTLPNLSNVYPWATLQFLCVKDWSTLSGDRSKVQFEAEWSDFLKGLRDTYTGAGSPLLEGASGAMFLDQFKIKNIERMKGDLCATGGAKIVRPKEVKDGLLRIQGLYERHTAAVWGILNKLIFTVVDPDTKIEHVRLHPDVLKADTAERYVEARATETRRLLSKFYIDIEAAYVEAAQSLKVVG